MIRDVKLDKLQNIGEEAVEQGHVIRTEGQNFQRRLLEVEMSLRSQFKLCKLRTRHPLVLDAVGPIRCLLISGPVGEGVLNKVV